VTSPLQPAVINVVGEDPLDDLPDGVSPNAQQPGDRGLGHVLRQPRDHVLEVAGVMGARPCPGDRLEMHAAGWAAKATQLGLDHAPARPQTEVSPPLGSPVVHLEPAGLPATPTDTAPAAQTDGHDHPLAAEADVVTDAPGRRNSRLNAVLTRTSLSFVGG